MHDSHKVTSVDIMNMKYHVVVRSNVKAELARKDIQGQAAAEEIGMSAAMLSSRLHGRSDWRLGELVKLAEMLDIPFSRLVEGIDSEVAAAS